MNPSAHRVAARWLQESRSRTRLANRWLSRQAAEEIVSAPLPRTAKLDAEAARVRREMTAEVLAAFGEAVVDDPNMRTANLSRRMKQLWEAFQTAPAKWDAFKKMLGVKATGWIGIARELPGKIKGMFREAKKYLSRVGQLMYNKIPLLRLYIDVGIKLPSVGDWLKKAVDYMPEPIQKAIQAISSRATSLAKWLDDLVHQFPVVKPGTTLVSAALFAYIWFNVVEISWDVPEIMRGFLGGYSFLELLHSLPESAMGFVLGMLFPGIPGGLLWNAILPITIAMRLGWLIHKHYIEFAPGSREMIIHWDRLGIAPPPAAVPAKVSF